MKILLIHQVPYRKMDYRLGIDHDRHDVTYIGYPQRIADLPADLRCRRIELTTDEDLVPGIISRVSREDGFEHVLALSEFGILEAYHVRRHLGLDGPSKAQLELVRDKVKMKEAIAQAGVRYPRFVATPSPAGTLPWSGKTVVKPRQGASSEGVCIYADAEHAVAANRASDNPGDFQFEEYIEGDILYADGLVEGGKVTNFAVSKYVNTPLDFIGGKPLGAHHVANGEQYREFVLSVVEAIDVQEGCIHLEFFLTPQREPVFLEIANRVGGAGVVNAYLRHTGVHLPSHEIAIRLGTTLPEPDPPSGKYHGWLVFPGHHLPRGSTLFLGIPEHLREHPCVDRFHTLAPSAPLPDHVTYQEWLVPLFIEASHSDPGVLEEFLGTCARSVTVEAKVNPS
ncbi:MAG: ATP-grasp domain-containing protein [Pseudonocardiaceae bacterium]